MITVLAAFVSFAPLSIRIEGRGFLRVDHLGRLAYASQATLTAKGGLLTTIEGDTLVPEISVPTSAKSVSVGLDGTVKVGEKELGRLVLAQLKGETAHSTVFYSNVKPSIGFPGDGLFGVVRVGGSSATPPPSSGQAKAPKTISIEIKPLTEVNPGNYTLGDIATISTDDESAEKLKALVLGPCPSIGIERLISGSLVTAKIRGIGFNPTQFSIDVPDGAKIVGRSQLLDGSTIVDLAKKTLEADFGGRVTFESAGTPAKLVLPPGELTTTATVENRSITSVQVRVAVSVDGKPVASRILTLAPEPGTPSVRAGDTLKVRVRQNGAVIEMAARALSSGLIGQTIKLETTNAPIMNLTATIVASGTVEVRL